MKKYLMLLFICVVVGLTFRVYRLADRPLGFTWDEAALGYNAYSLLLTGKDEHGQSFPIIFKSFGDYKPGLYIYLTVLPTKVLGLNEFSTRLPSAIFGTISLICVYLFVVQLFNKKAALASVFVLMAMPWAIHFSRGAWEANVAISLTLLAATLFLYKKYSLSAIFFGLTLWTYQGSKLFTPFIILTLFILYKKNIALKKVVLPLVLLVACAFPVLINFGSQSGRLKVFSVFSYTRSSETVSKIASQDEISQSSPLFQIFHAEIIDQGRGIWQRYLNYFSPRFLFKEGSWASLRETTPFYGNLHLIDLVSFGLGLYVLARTKTKGAKLLGIWLLAAPIPAAFSRDIISGVRSLPMTIPLAVILGLGLAQLATKKIGLLLYLPIWLFLNWYYVDLFINHAPFFSAQYWSYAYKPALTLVKQNASHYDHIIISDKLGQPYIYVLYYNQIDPRSYQNNHVYTPNSSGDVGKIDSFGKYTFRPIYWPADRGEASSLYVGDSFELPESDLQGTAHINRLGQVNYPDGSPALTVVGLP